MFLKSKKITKTIDVFEDIINYKIKNELKKSQVKKYQTCERKHWKKDQELQNLLWI